MLRCERCTLSEREDVALDAAMNQLMRTTPPMDAKVSARLLLEAKEIFDSQGVTFFLRQGTCLGAIRDHAFIPWDDDIDIGSILGLHGFEESMIEPLADAFRARGFYVKRDQFAGETWLGLMKDNIRIDWSCLRVRKGHVVHFPGARFPIDLFKNLREIDFLGQKFLVANPPEEYLRIKYGPTWMTPNQFSYGKDVVANLPAGSMPGHPSQLTQRVLMRVFPNRVVKLRILDWQGVPVLNGEVVVAAWGTYKANGAGYVRLYVPRVELYALVVRGSGREEVLYEEELSPGKTYEYRPDPGMASGRIFVLAEVA
jgi:hypothetical protein